jgi:hypothetical protein
LIFTGLLEHLPRRPYPYMGNFAKIKSKALSKSSSFSMIYKIEIGGKFSLEIYT